MIQKNFNTVFFQDTYSYLWYKTIKTCLTFILFFWCLELCDVVHDFGRSVSDEFSQVVGDASPVASMAPFIKCVLLPECNHLDQTL